MPEVVRVFQAGKMNKDLDERLVPNGEYRDALNLDLANSDNGNMGSLQNVKGTLQLRSKEGKGAQWSNNYIDSLSNPVCIGTYSDDLNEKVYWFIASDSVSAIAEYDQTNNVISPVIVDTANILKFSTSYLITAINIIDKLLFWTDNQTEPKKINIDKFKTGSVDFSTQTKIPIYIPANGLQPASYSTTLTGLPDFTEEDVTVIKKSPLTAPLIDSSASKFGNGIPGTGITPVATQMTTASMINFTYAPVSTLPNDRTPLDTYGEYLTNIATDSNFYANTSIPGWNGEVTFQVNTALGDQWAENSLIILESDFTTEFYDNYKWQISLKLTSVSNTTVTGQIQAISSDIQIFTNEAGATQIFTWNGLLVEEAPMFEYVFPRFAYRWKYIDNEYSTFSPFSEVAFEGGEFEYLSSDGHNTGMTNNIRKLIVSSLSWGNQEVQELDILFKESNSNAVYKVDTLKRKDFDTLPSTFQIETELIGAIIESNQILRPWDNVPLKAKAQEVIGNRIVYGNYLQNYNVDTVSVNLTSTPANHEAVSDPSKMRFPNPSVKSKRTYQAGVVFADKYGRETPVFTSKQGSTKIDIEDSDKANKLTVTPAGDAPEWASHYKFFIKENSNEYYNLALDKFYDAEDGNVWLSFPSSERNKVDIETYLILKKQHDTDVPVKTFSRYKILDIENEAPEFISTFDNIVSSTTVEVLNPVEVGFLSIGFKGPDPTSDPQFGPKLNGNKIQISLGSSKTAQYDVLSVNTSSDTVAGISLFEMILTAPLGSDALFLESVVSGDNIDIAIFEEQIKNKPEFEGRFFVKVNRDFDFDKNIISSFAQMPTQYAIKSETTTNSSTFEGENPPVPAAYYYSDYGNPKRNTTCSSQKDKLKLVGWDGGVGSNIINTPNEAAIQDKMGQWQPPTRGSEVFGIQTLRNQGPNSYVDLMFGHIASQFKRDSEGNTLNTGTGVSPNGYLSVGADIRFQNSSTNELSQIYTIKYALGQFSYRGGRQSKGNFSTGCEPLLQPQNRRYAIYIELDKPLEEQWFPENGDWSQLQLVNPSIQAVSAVISNDNKLISSTNPAIFETEPKENIDLDLYYEASDSIPISSYNNPSQDLSWFNCYSYGQGVESNRIRDDYNAVTIGKGVKVSTVLDEPYAAERRASSFIFSQIFNSTSGINRLNQFIQAEAITKDLNPIHGSIQKLHARDTDLITLCEDKCFRILANKDALYNADGNVNVTSNQAVLGQAVPYAGNFGISQNPESFADYGFRIYFSDRNRGAVIRLSRDGITTISSNGMSDFFEDNLITSSKIVGNYDEDKGVYNITLDNLSYEWQEKLSADQSYNLTAECDSSGVPSSLVTKTTVSFKESVRGWTSRKSFLPESGVSLNNRYYTFNKGLIWENGANPIYNNFYGVQYNSSFNVLVNEMPQIVKGFTALNYTGTASREIEYEYNNKWYSIEEINANQFLPTSSKVNKDGWHVNYIRTNLEAGEIKEFANKEGKYFNYIKTLEVCKTGDGIGAPDIIVPDPQDYILTLTIDPACSGSMVTNLPDTNQKFWNTWSNPNPSLSINIVNESTALSAKCSIEGFYDSVNQNYTGISKNGITFSYIFSDDLGVGTQLYNASTSLPLTQGGTYLFVSKDIPSIDTPSDAALDANNSLAVPDSYYLMIINSSGVIVTWTQYNTLASCSPANPNKTRKFNAGLWAASASPSIPSINYSSYGNNTDLLCGIRTYITSFFSQSPAPGKGWSVKNVYWDGPNDIVIGTVLYGLYSGVYTLATNEAYIQTIENPDAYGGNISYETGSNWTDISSIPDSYLLIKTNASGAVSEITQINTISNPSCP